MHPPSRVAGVSVTGLPGPPAPSTGPAPQTKSGFALTSLKAVSEGQDLFDDGTRYQLKCTYKKKKHCFWLEMYSTHTPGSRGKVTAFLRCLSCAVKVDTGWRLPFGASSSRPVTHRKSWPWLSVTVSFRVWGSLRVTSHILESVRTS